MSIPKVFFATGLALLGAAVWADDTNPWNGKWSAHVAPSGKRAFDALVTLEGSGGVWKAQGTDHNDPCAGHESPIEVQTANADDLVFRIMMSKSMPGCPDTTARLKRVDDNKLTGTRWTAPMTLVREK